MAEFLVTSGISHHIENIIMDAKESLTLVSPFLQISKTLYQRLQEAASRGVKITIVYGKDELKPNERNSLAEIKSIKLYYLDNLHAKCYHNEETMIITSMNMFEFSEKNNREMGVLIQAKEDKALFDKVLVEVMSIIRVAEFVQVKEVPRYFYGNKNQNDRRSSGYCIRCESRIDYNPERPYCWSCFTTWNQFQNLNYAENVCHSCGKYADTSMTKSQCYTCFNNMRKL